ncbi:SixA phosphatase family protein [Gemmata sp.]|uniref:SixA phosphatase family protein n=1 Tax=Gemmata sp. TaxID=1914242 RepID=UPI003F71FC12
MWLYLIRHAEAEPLGGALTRDFDRPLTAAGRAQSRALAAAFARRGVVIDTLAASPLVRAHQTAAELLGVWAPGTRPVTCDDLAIGSLRAARLTVRLAELPAAGPRLPAREDKAVAAVGHMPDLGAYLEWLTGAATGTVRFAKAGAACVHLRGDLGRGCGVLEWLVTPEWC